jgi:hypothetical protein
VNGVKNVQAKDARAVRKAIDENEEFVLFDGDEPLYRCTPVAQALEKDAKRFHYYPHDPAECLYTCWRHPRVAEQAPHDEQPVPATTP